MEKAEELRLHNLFIKLKNEGKTITEIQKELSIDNTLLIKWNEKFQTTLNEINNLPKYKKSRILEVNEDGQYIYDSIISFSVDLLEKAKFDLQRILQSEDDSEFTLKLKEQAKKHLNVFSQYLENINEISKEGNEINARYTLKSDYANNQNAKQLVSDAVKFYSNHHFGMMEIEKLVIVQKPTKDIYSNINAVLPYALKSLVVQKFNGIIHTSFEQLPIDTQWIFLTGENGYGKTTLLQAITIGLFGEKDEDRILVKHENNDFKIGVEFFNRNRSEIHNIGINFNPFLHLACYGPSRLQIQNDDTRSDAEGKSTTTYSLFKSNGVLLNIENELLLWHLEPNIKFDNVKTVLLKLIPYLADIQVDVPNRKIFYIEKEPSENGETYNPVTFEQLASGFRSLILMVGDMMIRLFKSQPTINEPSELAGIVIIDELDLHWHPKLQRELPKLLSTIFPKVQFIASTHSLVPLLGAPENSVLLKVNRTIREGITVEKVDIDFQSLSSDVMLRDIFDLEKYMSDVKQKAWERFNELKGLIHFETNEENKKAYWKESERLADKFQFEL